MQVVGAAAMEAPAGRDPRDAEGRDEHDLPGDAGGRPGPLRARPVRRLPRRSTGSRPDSTTETYAALELEIDNWRWSGVPFYIRTGKLPAGHPDRAAARVPAPAAARLPRRRRARPEPNQLVIKLDPTTGVRLLLDAQRGGRRSAEQIHLDMEFAEEGGEGPAPYEVLLHAAMKGDSTRFTRQDGVEEAWRVHAAAARRAAAGPSVRAGQLGPGGGRRPARRARPLARPVGAVMTAAATARRADRPAAERGGAVAVPADRRLRVPLELPHRRAGRARRRDRLAVRAALRLAERVRHAARPRGRLRSGSARSASTIPVGARVRARHERARHDLADAERLGGRARRADDGPAPRRGHDHAAHAAAGRRRRRAPAGAHGRVHRRRSVEVELVCEPVFDYGREPAEWSLVGDGPPRRRRDRRRA